ncbi:MAG TPA: beta-L-arabinofuranosidase domain-containing protein [Vicinamibacteria bacterium]|nr:beta-L-arabinofuranosidase domain-containing protein [Vicinamibacteria bacterium]
MSRYLGPLACAFLSAFLLAAQPPASARSASYPIRGVPFTKVQLTDAFWAPRIATNRKVTIPFGLKKSEEEGRLRNFERAAHKRTDAYEGKMPFDDTDVYKLIEGASYSLQTDPDPELERYIDGMIAVIASGQEADGYLTTYKTIDPTKSPADWLKPGPKWDLELEGSHELYNAGHLYEAAYAHYRATGKRTLLEVALKNADLLDRTFGPGKRLTPPGHQIVETGLFKLAEATGEERYRRLGRFFLDQRGNAEGHKLHGTYNQDHQPVVAQREAVGHAVRAAYMYAAMVDVAALEDDPLYREAVERIWDDVVSRKLYVTGGLGAQRNHEGFSEGFDLPNRTAYAETCASIASVYWNQRLFLLSGDSKYVDVLERTLFNAAIAGVSLAGDTFFYPNPLEADGRDAFNMGAATRKPWFDCSCCPTNLARFIPSLPDYVYAVRGADDVFVNLFVASRASFDVLGKAVSIAQTTAYPWAGRVELRLDTESPRPLALHVRVPGWARGQPVPGGLYRYVDGGTGEWSLQVNGEPFRAELVRGYAVIARTWKAGDTVTIDLPMRVRRVVADERVADDRGKVALERGPIVYCAEGIDNGGSVLDVALPDDARLDARPRPDLLGGVHVIEGSASTREGKARPFTAIPYYAWSNRGPGEMAVWFPRAP